MIPNEVDTLESLKEEICNTYLKYQDFLDDLENKFNIIDVDHHESCDALKDKNQNSCSCGAYTFYGNNDVAYISSSIRNCIYEIAQIKNKIKNKQIKSNKDIESNDKT